MVARTRQSVFATSTTSPKPRPVSYKPGTCTMHETCDSYVVVEYNGDVYPCDFFVEAGWKLGNVTLDSWPEIARRTRRYSFAAKKTLAHPECQACEYQSLCHGGCPKYRHAPHGQFEELDYFCQVTQK